MLTGETYLGNLGDQGDPIEYGGLFVYVDANGRAYAEYVTRLDDDDTPEKIIELLDCMVSAIVEQWKSAGRPELSPDEEANLKEALANHFEDEFGHWEIYRWDLDKCTFINGILSDNPYHPEHPAWWATPECPSTTYLRNVCSAMDVEEDELIRLFCSDNPLERAEAYRCVAETHGYVNFDQYHLDVYSLKEMKQRYKLELETKKPK